MPAGARFRPARDVVRRVRAELVVAGEELILDLLDLLAHLAQLFQLRGDGHFVDHRNGRRSVRGWHRAGRPRNDFECAVVEQPIGQVGAVEQRGECGFRRVVAVQSLRIFAIDDPGERDDLDPRLLRELLQRQTERLGWNVDV